MGYRISANFWITQELGVGRTSGQRHNDNGILGASGFCEMLVMKLCGFLTIICGKQRRLTMLSSSNNALMDEVRWMP
jgi:hypothetical protein